MASTASRSKNLPPVADSDPAVHEFETVESQTLYTGKIFALRADEVLMPGGKTARREVVEHYGAVAIVALDDDGNVVMVYQYRHPLGRRLWELPAGLLDVAGEPAHLTAARELEEEVGLAADDWQVLVDVVSTPGFTDESVRVYLATGLSEIDRPDAHDEEADMRTQRFPLADAVQMVFNGEIVNALAVAGILAAQAVHQGVASARPVDAEWVDKPTRFAARKAADGKQ
jgi:8-oxo-dGTP pyrophosphatase MutT (NUDIX family)